MTDPTVPTVRAFLDANVLYAAALGSGGSSQLWEMASVVLVTNEYAAKEAWDNLARRDDHGECLDRLTMLLSRMEVHPCEIDEVTQPLFCAWALPDPTDIPILLGAIERNCHYLLSLDSDCFGQFYGRSLDGVVILKPGKFLALHGR